MKVYAARQPIFDVDGKIFGYEFLYRDSGHNEFNKEISGNMATCLLLSNMLSEFGLENLTGGTYAFLNLTEDLILSDYLRMLDPQHFVVEILEDVSGSDEILERLLTYKEKGYLFAMDDYAGGKERLVESSDILKVDFRLTGKREQRSIAERYGGEKVLLAEKVETAEEKAWAVKNGYSLMQGYFFSKPVLLSKEKTEVALATYVRILKEFSGRDPDFDRLAETIKVDVNLSYKFLLRVNTLQYGGKYRINSIKQSLVRMGLLEVKRWTLAILLRDVFGKKDNEAAKRALIRGVFTEKIADLLHMENLDEEAYMVGMFSTIDVSVKDSLEELLSQVRISQAASEALFYRAGELGKLLDFVENYEKGNWEQVNEFLEEHRLEQVGISVIYFDAVTYAETMFKDYKAAMTQGVEHYMEPLDPLLRLLAQQNSGRKNQQYTKKGGA